MVLELGAKPDVNDQREGGIGQIGSSRSICLGWFPLFLSFPLPSFPLLGCWSRANQEHKTQLHLSLETGIASHIREPLGSRTMMNDNEWLQDHYAA